ncbi:MAG: hypothetical protein ACRYGF_09670 [Janthinobacterium lividum]
MSLRKLHRSLSEKDGFSPAWLTAIFFAVLLLVFSRRPGDLLHAQFYAEDARWFAQAYNLGWLHSLQIPDASYLQVLPRVFAGIALHLPLYAVPLALNLAGAALQVSPVVALLSQRCSNWGCLPVRIAMAAVYIASPNAVEIHVNITNAQWHYGLLQVLLAFSRPPSTKVGRFTDVFIFLLGSISGPFDIVLLPILLLSWLSSRERWTLILAACLTVGSILQLYTLSTKLDHPVPEFGVPESARVMSNRVPLGASPTLFTRILGSHVYLDSVIGDSKLDRTTILLPACALLVGTFVTLCGILWGPRSFRFFSLYGLLLFAAALKTPVVFASVSRWYALSLDAGMRYYFLPTTVFLWGAIYAVQYSPRRIVRLVCLCPLVLFVLGLRKWEYAAYPVSHYAESVQRFEHARTGEAVIIPTYPQGWSVTLLKH